jgi:hypothetical protein
MVARELVEVQLTIDNPALASALTVEVYAASAGAG